MELKDRIIKIRKEKRLRIKDIHDRLLETFGKEALSCRTLLRSEQGSHEERDSTLYQLCVGLGVSLKELTEGLKKTEVADAYLVKFNKRKDHVIHNENVYADVLSSSSRKFYVYELTLKAKGRTKPEKDPSGEKTSPEKLLYVTKGKINCVIEGKAFFLRRNETLTFDSSHEHYIENKATKKSRCLVVQNPGRLPPQII